MPTIRLAATLCSLAAPLAACAGHAAPLDGGGPADVFHAPDVADAAPRDASPDVPAPYDAGAAPACAITASATHIVDRPGGDLVSDPASLVAVPSGGYLVAYRHLELDPPDGGVTDGAVVPTSRDSLDILALGADGAPRGTATPFYDAAPVGNRTDVPTLLPNAAGGFALFQESHGMASDPVGFVLRVRGGVVDATGAGAAPGVLRDNVTAPAIATLAGGNMLGVASQISNPTDAGTVTAVPVSLLLLPDGGSARARDVDISTVLPFDAADGVVRASDDGGALYVFRSGGHPGFLRFAASGAIDAHGPYMASGATVPSIDDAVATAGAVFAVYSQAASGGAIEVHAVVLDAASGAARADVLVESATGATATPVTVVPAYGGVAVLWKRGGDADAHVRAAVVQPDGVVRVAAADVVATPHAGGRVVAVVSGRSVAFVMRDGTAPAWGYSFGAACLGAGGM